ncbi:hypothetical protein OS122_02395 [Mycolicibacterium mucogenicum]|uniref:hypothetical protein n=1 Tax=Mycolicibacterium mucogenicum TaxID=56689 RepID=UPI00226AACE8|nr:hypothetical protein [Mycolicibacterium mucogenicum]MCX8559748.1 hypothetical protein [Mycolicibacterium mucogenicum]
MAEYEPPAAPWPIEEVWPRDLKLGDVINIAGNFPWLEIVRLGDVPESDQFWELGSRWFHLAPPDGAEGAHTITFDNHNVRTVFRRVHDDAGAS